MSINSCSINEHTINTLCGRRRQAIIDWLTPHAQVGGGQQQHVNPTNNLPANLFRRNEHEENVVDITTLELENIQVTIEMQGEVFSQTLKRDNAVPMVNVYGMSVKDRMTEQVKVADFRINILHE